MIDGFIVVISQVIFESLMGLGGFLGQYKFKRVDEKGIFPLFVMKVVESYKAKAVMKNAKIQ